MSSKSNNFSVELNSKDRDQTAATEKMIRLFNKKYRESGLLYELRENDFYEKPSDTKRRIKSKKKKIQKIYKLIRAGKLKAKNKRLQQEVMDS
jgi:ribosomal protein S21